MDRTDMVAELRDFVDRCRSNPSTIHDPSLSFFREYLLSIGATIPQQSTPSVLHMEDANVNFMDDVEGEIIESDLEFDDELVEPDNDPPQQMGDISVDVSEESSDAAQSYKKKAIESISEGKLYEAIQYLTDAILLNPHSAILYATRANVFVKMKKPNAAMRDADAAIKINPDSAKGFKSRGMAKGMLGQWEDAVKDLHLASRLDHDEEINAMLKKVEPNLNKFEKHHKKYERLRRERESRRIQREKQQKHADAEPVCGRERQKRSSESSTFPDTELEDPESLEALNNGAVISIQSSGELEKKLKVASKLSRLTILYFTATWCGPCRFIGPVFKDLAEKNQKIVFLKVDIDQLGEVAMRWNVNSVPTFFFVKNGKEIDKEVGADKNGLQRKIALHSRGT